jgi:hypothetical protein
MVDARPTSGAVALSSTAYLLVVPPMAPAGGRVDEGRARAPGRRSAKLVNKGQREMSSMAQCPSSDRLLRLASRLWKRQVRGCGRTTASTYAEAPAVILVRRAREVQSIRKVKKDPFRE